MARSVVEAERLRGLQVPAADSVQAVVGHGVVGLVNGQRRWVGKLRWFADTGTYCDPSLTERAAALQAEGYTLVGVADEERVLGLLSVADPLRPTAAAAIQEFV